MQEQQTVLDKYEEKKEKKGKKEEEKIEEKTRSHSNYLSWNSTNFEKMLWINSVLKLFSWLAVKIYLIDDKKLKVLSKILKIPNFGVMTKF